MQNTFEPSSYEKRIYQSWLDQELFKADNKSKKKPFTIVMPPPNVTGKLHIGHALNNTVQDIIIRYKRMSGFETLWLPGTDHAALATEVEMLKAMAKEGLTKEMLGREAFLERANQWFSDFGGTILHQLKELGISCDWSRLAFTMDKNLSKAVKHVFLEYYNKGLIYRGSKITNYCIHCGTAISDTEVTYVKQTSKLFYFNYVLEDKSGALTVATTRPETIFGDQAVAVNPNDKRYKDFIGKNVLIPISNKPIKVIADDYVDMKFGTGALKITPAHDVADSELGLKHNLEVVNVINKDGKLNDLCMEFSGQDRFVARDNIMAKIKELGLFVKEETYNNNVAVCDRCKTVIEPLITKQWFVKMKELARPAIDCVRSGELKYIPKRFEKQHFNWLLNIQDWCISRQIWLGHQIPIYYCEDCGEVVASEDMPKVCPKCKGSHFVQDPDVLDTWFSSALWPFSTLGYPDLTPDLKYFYPTSVLVTAYDIISFWVTKMIFSGLEFMKQVPFKEVVINGLVRDSQGRKMSKSLHNGIDPLELIDKYGADATRFSLVYGMSMGADVNYSEEKAKHASNFLNKLYNASKFVLMHCENLKEEELDSLQLSLADKWILNELNLVVKNVNKLLDKYEQGLALSILYDFVWGKFCDWYIELCKTSLFSTNEKSVIATKNVLQYCLKAILKMLHPYVPFVTEEVYQNLSMVDKSIMIEKFPLFDSKKVFKKESEQMEEIIKFIKLIRNFRAEMKIPDNKKISIIIVANTNKELLTENAENIEKLAMLSEAKIVDIRPVGDEFMVIKGEIADFYADKNEIVDTKKEKERLDKLIEKTEFNKSYFEKRLNNPAFVAKAPKQLVDNEKLELAKITSYLEELKNSRLALN